MKLQARILSLVTLAVFAIGCAKEKSYEEKLKESTFSKSAISTDPNDPYVYIPSVGETPMSVTASRSFWMGDQKLATFRFEEGALIAMELPSDERFAANTSNQSPILRVKIDHKDYRCKEDAFGECGNQEEEIDDRPWAARRFFKADFAEMKVTETNTLPEQLAASFSKCYGAEETVVKDVKIENDAVNIHVQKRWKAEIRCADFENLTSFADLLRDQTFTVNYYYSFVKLSKLKDPNYKAVNYPFEDQNTFGYFKTDIVKLSNDGRNIIGSEQNFMNRWSPNRKEIVYYMNDGFYKEGMESIREATAQGVQTINNTFEKAGIPTRIKLEDGRGKFIGDLRNSFLILVSDPQASGVIGYGPSVANPRTGEILKAQTVMYYGSIKRQIEQTYDDLVSERLRAQADRRSAVARSLNLPSAGAPASQEVAERIQLHQDLYSPLASAGRIAAPSARRNSQFGQHNIAQTIGRDLSRGVLFSSNRRVELSTWLAKLADPNVDEVTRYKATMEEMSHHCFYHDSLVNWHDLVGSAMESEDLGVDSLKPWIELTEDERAKVIDKLMPMVWVPTLVHEIGHNLGLRHNFSGSEDKANYYNESERRSLGIKREVPYSSIMDYSYSELNVLPVLGKYDIAALKYGYKREVELTDGTHATLPDDFTFERMNSSRATAQDAQVKAKFKDFQYCTDEHVEVNPGCNRHDEGSGPKAIAQHYVNSYKKAIEKRNYRNNRARFSIVNDGSYYYRLDHTFESLRRFFEQYDRLSNDPRWGALMAFTDAQWEEQLNNAPDEVKPIVISNRDFFKEIREAAQISADFFLEVLTTPDVMCVLVKAGEQELAGIEPLSVFSPDGEAVNCFDKENIGINPAYEIVGEVGRFFNHQRQKSLLPGQLSAAADELSVRGIWMDKLLAINWLTARELDNTVFDEYRNNYLDYPIFGDKIRATLVQMLTDNVTTTTEMRMADGSKRQLEVTYPIADTHQIKTVVLMPFHARRGLERVQTDFRKLVLKRVKSSLQKADDVTKTLGLFNTLSAVEVGPTTVLDAGQVGATAEFRDASNNLIGRFAATKDQPLAALLIQQRNVRNTLDKFKREEVIAAYQALVAGQIPTEIAENLKPLYQAPKEVLLAYLRGELPTDEFLIPLLRIMSESDNMNVRINVNVNP